MGKAQTKRAAEVRESAKRLLAKELGMSLVELERRASEMSETRRTLEKELGQIKLETYGIDIGHHDRLAIASVQHSIDEAWASIAKARACLRGLMTSAVLPVHSPRIEPLLEMLDQAGRLVRKVRPVALCPACKRIGEVMVECGTCLSTGYITMTQMKEIDDALLNKEQPVVRFRGRLLPVEQVK